MGVLVVVCVFPCSGCLELGERERRGFGGLRLEDR